MMLDRLCLRGAEETTGLKRILSQSTESLNFRNRTLSMESLTDDGVWISRFLSFGSGLLPLSS